MAKAGTPLLEHSERALLMAQRARAPLSIHTWAHVRFLWSKVYGDLLCISRRCAA